jgi:ELWxxDGT repeat protein
MGIERMGAPMLTNVLIYRAWGENGLGVFGHVLGTEYTYEITTIDPDRQGPGMFSPAGEGFVFADGGGQLIYSDGSSGGTLAIALDQNGNAIDSPFAFSQFGDQTIFLADTDSVAGIEEALFITDGGNTPQILLPFGVEQYQIVGDTIYVVHDNGDLYRVDAEGNSEFIIGEDPVSGGLLNISYMFELHGELYFRGFTPNVSNFYRVDAATGDVERLDGIYVPSTAGLYFGAVSDEGFFFWRGHDNSVGNELYFSDGTAAGTHLTRDINLGEGCSYYSTAYVEYPAILSSKLIFVADDGSADGAELWVSDGTEGSATPLSGSSAGNAVGNLHFGFGFQPLTVDGLGLTFFVAHRDDVGREIFVTDGTAAGTRLLTEIVDGVGDADPANFATDGNLLYFSVTAGGQQDWVWVSDGTAQGTFALSDPNPGGLLLNNEPSEMSFVELDTESIPLRIIEGDEFDNVLAGSILREAIVGLGGDDILFGGSGADLFAFAAGSGDDEIGDFVLNTDHLTLSGITIASTSEVDGNNDSIADTLVTFSSGDTVLLAGVTGVTDSGDLIA